MNKIIITGRLTRDTEIKAANTGTEYCNFTVAVDRRAKKGEEKRADFFDCTAWGKTAAFVNQYFKKGDGIVIDGRMESRKYVDKDGNNRTAWGVTVDNVEFAQGKAKGDTANTADTTATFNPVDIDDGDLPF